MGITKTALFTAQQNEFAQIAKVLGHPARLAIIEYLLETKTCICGDLVDELGLAQATISQHLRELKKTGIIQGTIEGTSVCYCIEPKKWEETKNLFMTLFNKYPSTADQDCC
ncbi:MAG: metalloregulator ArsR/SmtB family transcription factor [Psychroflexus sp.]|nr:metalloregulator ArsR/SmtB family transcription factor [Psychroflexus sp.]MDN6310482.1 metalloregulator ArsR/SmtB family transcription factor [Psychroflexus sp.]